MSNPSPQKSYLKPALIFAVAAIAALIVILVVLAYVGDEVPNELPAATETSPGN
jgi:hypothetical protein